MDGPPGRSIALDVGLAAFDTTPLSRTATVVFHSEGTDAVVTGRREIDASRVTAGN